MLEERGIATTVVALVQPHVEQTRPPRALVTPFMLGRPLGEPNDVAFQRRVLLQALKLLTDSSGQVVLEHFPDDNPSWFDRPGWRAAVTLEKPVIPADAKAWEAAFRAELNQVLPVWDRFKTRFGRSSVGLSGQPVEQWPAFAAAFLDSTILDGALPTVPLHDTPALAIRFLTDDVKALYGEAAQAEGGAPSARQIDWWFWRETLAGQMLLALRTSAMQSENNGFKTVGSRFFVPVPYVPVVPPQPS